MLVEVTADAFGCDKVLMLSGGYVRIIVYTAALEPNAQRLRAWIVPDRGDICAIDWREFHCHSPLWSGSTGLETAYVRCS